MPGENLTRAEAAERASLVTTRSYDVALDLTTSPKTFVSRTVARFSATPGASTFIDLIAPAVHEVVLNGRALDPADVVADSRIRLDGLAEENELLVVAECAYMHTGEGLHRFVDPVDDEVYLYSQFEVADSRRVFAVFEQPDLKATFTFTVTAPAHWTVVSNYPQVGEPEPVEGGRNLNGGKDAGTAVWRFETTPRLASYVTAVVAGPYHGEHRELTSSDGRTIPLGVYCRASLAPHLDTDEIVDVTRRGFAFFEEAFDHPYPFAKYDQLFVPEFNAGAMENAGAVTFLESYVFRSKVPDATVERRAVTILHELAHMWFGDLVTMRWWDDLWLNESFAEYASTLAAAEATRWTTAWTTFSSLEKSWAYRQDQLPSTHPIVADMRDLEDVEVNFDGITYAKGASVLKQLVSWVGQEHFFAGVRQYFAKHAWGNTQLRDLLTELEATSGRDLSAWSGLWLEKAGVTLLRPEIGTDDAGVITSFAVLQEVPAEHPVQRPHRLAVGGYDVHDVDGAPRLVRTWRVELDVDGDRTEVPELVGRPRPALVLVNDDDLAYAKVRLDDRSMATAIAHLGAFTDSLPRTLVWAAAWDATRDGETPGRDFVDLVLGNVAHETDSSVVLVLLRQLASTLDLYVAPEHRAATQVAAADRLLALAQAAPAGSDQQLQLVKAFAGRASTAAQLDAVADLLDGRTVLDGLTVDTDLRWELLTSLVAGGRADETQIAAQLSTDATATGQRAAAAARAAVPTPEAKERAWAQVVTGDELPNALQAATIAGFGRVHDTALLVPWVAPYFDALEDVWAGKTSEMAQNVVVGMFPTDLAGDASVDVLAATDAWLAAHPDAPAALRRLVAEARDGVRRAVAAQEADRARA
ncbi:aminopeptidase N [Cellulomonas oligotrophica]|uniref:Aminopeptidase N n=1 Tax=Cellulomonas oligotrophica TaxID=931536 RepID=A0A7Y9FIK3_9CELL|nr:aminopeptidase N [Cellulomonas oligotrophica]NYD87970.1 aminopeptidase N [Cellulomonas oligotrophica]GIG34466.1 aminopeptidase N [Cellulomonas oligotrophica]